MGISSALYTGVSGLNTNGQAMSVIGNNLANTNTTAYKGSRSLFSDLLSATVSGSGGPSQVGRGVGLSTIDNLYTQGTFQSTSNSLDLAIEGSSFFVVSPGNADTVLYTRAGAFNFNEDGFMVNSEGLRLQGVMYDAAGNLAGGDPTDIFLSNEGLVAGQATDTLTLNTNLASNEIVMGLPFDATNAATYSYVEQQTVAVDAGADSADINVYYRNTAPNIWEVHYSATKTLTGEVSNDVTYGLVELDPATGTYTNNPAGTPFTGLPIGTTLTWTGASPASTTDTVTAVAAANDLTATGNNILYFDYQNPDTYTYSASVQTFDSLGNPQLLTTYYRKSDVNTWDVYYSAEDSTGATIPADPNAAPLTTLFFGPNGTPVDSTATNNELANPPTASTIPIDWNNGSDPTQIQLIFDTTQFNSDSRVISQDQNGYGAGSLTGINMDDKGNVVASYSNGVKTNVAAISLAKFTNTKGLSMEGSNTYEATRASGPPRVGLMDAELGTIYSYSLEQSNVDMAAEMVNMITVQRGYQANSKIITTVDEMLGELINLKR
ncbi:MAG: flagellar hook protein FlgE [Desulfotalea sp.]